MKNTMAMIVDVVAGLKDVLLSIIGLGVLVQLIFVRITNSYYTTMKYIVF